jgi:hypothetical protein
MSGLLLNACIRGRIVFGRPAEKMSMTEESGSENNFAMQIESI